MTFNKAITSARRVADRMDSSMAKARAEGRDLTDAETSQLASAFRKALDDVQREAASAEGRERGRQTAELLQKVADGPHYIDGQPVSRDGVEPQPATGGFRASNPKGGRLFIDAQAATKAIVDKASRGGGGVKGLLAAGSTATLPVAALAEPVPQGRAANGLTDVLTSYRLPHGGDQFTWTRQVLRENNAAPWTSGEKPRSRYLIERVHDQLQVVAHVVEGISKYDLDDDASLAQFVSDEMLFGLRIAVEDQVLNGSGTAPELKGLLNTTGVRQQAYDTNPLVTIRRGLAQLESHDYRPHGVLMHPEAWADIETSMTTDGAFLFGGGGTLGAPIDAVERRLWGHRVALSSAVPQNTAVLLSDGAVALFYDKLGMTEVDPYSGFTANEVRFRCEVRVQVAALRPDGIVVADLAAAA